MTDMTDKEILSEIKTALKCKSYADFSRITGVGYSTLMNISKEWCGISNEVAKKLYAAYPHREIKARADVVIKVKPKRPKLPKQPERVIVVAPEPEKPKGTIIPPLVPTARIEYDNTSPEARKVHFIPDGMGDATGSYYVIETVVFNGKKALSIRRIGHGTPEPCAPLEVAFKEQTIHIR